jgi:hypothetical protein
VTLYSKHTGALTFENLCQVLREAARHGARSARCWGWLCCPLCRCFRRQQLEIGCPWRALISPHCNKVIRRLFVLKEREKESRFLIFNFLLDEQ